ncbi:MAG: hypothetical protein IJI06_09905 [Oscillospiraceae bacterium]|nr:hypothetical protein [Oscillospiraceae bacterium]
MANIELKGFDEYIRQLEALEKNSTKMCKAVVYAGAEILADKMRESVNGLPAMSDGAALAHYRAGAVMPMISESQKIGLMESLGISGIKKDRSGMVQASVGFTGYNGVKTRHFPNGQPNAEVARSLEKGTSYLRRDRFVERAVKAAKAEAIEAMAAEADAQIKRIMEKNGG